ncbi:MAG: ATP-binding protein [Limnochordia bacterium]|jgi:two-component system sensor histidine kinase ResE
MRSLFVKLLSSYLIICLITILVVALSLFHFFSNYHLNFLEKELTYQAQQLAARIVESLPTRHELQNSLDYFEQLIGARVWMVDIEGRVVATSARHRHWEGAIIERHLQQNLSSGRSLVRLEEDGEFSEPMITIAVPMVDDGTFLGGLLLYYPLHSFASTGSSVNGVLLRSVVLAVVFSVVVGLILSRKIAKPLQEMTRISLAMSKGNFDQRVENIGDDEVGQLAAAFNHLSDELGRTINALSQEKSKTESILASMTDGVIACDSAGEVILINPPAAEFFNHRVSEMVGQSVEKIVPVDQLVEKMRETIANHRGEELEIKHGHKIYVTRISPMVDSQGASIGAVAVLNDITKQRQLEELRRQFVANVSHELRTPLTAIRGFLQAILDGVVTDLPSVRKYLRIMLAESMRLIKLANSLLDLSKIEAGDFELYREPVRIRPIIEGVIDRLVLPLEDKELSLQLEVPQDLPLVYGDKDRLGQVFLNLLDNAVRFSPPGGQITVRAWAEDQYLRVEIIDGGVGISSEELPYIWDRFYKGDRSRRSGAGGTGLGLAIVKQLVEKHEGNVYVESSPDNGTCFGFSLPLAEIGETNVGG